MTASGRSERMAIPMTSRQYAKAGGNACPFCRGKNVETAGAIMPDDMDGASLEVECKDCGRAWKDVYKLVGYEADEEATGAEPGKEG